ncbi:MAG TPA: class I SAM-dependent methyltransferase [Rhodobacteraceae bacterium]|nr:class I SAM-dependent methyltransferase [Paracoccaceae bacterium]
MTTPLAKILIDRITNTGPISIADYMAECLLHPKHGYYTTRDPFGADGDFTTAPEISQMFGELLGLCLAQAWLEQGSPKEFVLAELGPGRGTLMADVLRATQGVSGFHAAANITLVEASPALIDIQRKTLDGYDVNWVQTSGNLPDGPLYLLANEFFDALPIRQFIFAGDASWRERRVGVEEDALVFGAGDAADVPALTHRVKDCREGDLVEVCAAAGAISEDIAKQIALFGGAAIFIDYGDWRSLGDTLQALRGHEFDSVLAHPGEADITAHVDFEALAVAAVSHTPVSKLIPQGELLARIGIAQRAEVLAQGLSGDQLETHMSALKRLTDPTEMGTLFKAIALYPNGHPPPAGFSA